jgi:hypothetical protein
MQTCVHRRAATCNSSVPAVITRGHQGALPAPWRLLLLLHIAARALRERRPIHTAAQVWSSGSQGDRYNRWWNEEHYGDGRVRKWGNSTGGEYWDAIEWMDTYYNPVPHFG